MIEPLLYVALMFTEPPQWVAQPLAIHFELLDQREIRYYNPEVIRYRARQLIRAPRAGRVYAFPPKGAVDQTVKFLALHLSWLDDVIVGWPEHQEYYKQWRREAKALWLFWNKVSDAQADHFYISYRRQKLQEIRDQMDPADWFFGNWPPEYPYWRFKDE